MTASIYQINIKPQTKAERGIPKRSVDSVMLTFYGLSGDYNIYRTERKNSDLNKAVMLISLEKLNDLKEEGWPVNAGDLGENFTTMGIKYSSFRAGQRYNIGEAQIEITEPCQPCNNLRVLSYVGDEKIKIFIKTLLGRRGWYAKVLVEGEVEKWDSIERMLYHV